MKLDILSAFLHKVIYRSIRWKNCNIIAFSITSKQIPMFLGASPQSSDNNTINFIRQVLTQTFIIILP